MKRAMAIILCAVTMCTALVILGASRDTALFTIHYGESKLVVTERMLSPQWWAHGDRREFAKNQTLQQRARLIDGVDDLVDVIERQFPEIWRIVTRIERDTRIDPCDGVVNFDPDADIMFTVTDQKSGAQLDVARLCGDILGALRGGRPIDVVAKIDEIAPTPTAEVLSRIAKRAEFTTTFDDNPGRECNIGLALESFDGLVVDDGKVVSFNTVVGPRLSARGYKEAKIIIDGEFVPGIGGGVCQVSTTVFNAVLRAGLRILESHNHSLPISYVPLGLDAMVSSQADLKFQNTTGSPIYIATRVVDKGPKNTATVTIYGKRPDHVYKPRSEVEVLAIKTEVRGEQPTVAVHGRMNFCHETGRYWHYDEQIIESGRNEKIATAYVDIYRDGELVDTRRIRKSRYKGKPRVVEYVRREVCIADSAF